VTPTPAGSLGSPDDRQSASLRRALARWRGARGRPAPLSSPAGDRRTPPVGRAAGDDIELADVELLRQGRPGVLDVVAEMDGRLAHAVFGLRRPGDELHLVGTVEEPTLGLVEDEAGIAVLVDALHDADAAPLLLDAVAGDADRIREARPTPGAGRGAHPPGAAAPVARRVARPAFGGTGHSAVAMLRDDEDVVALVFGQRCSLSVFPWLWRGPHPGVTFLAALDEAGFNHLAAPVAIWRRAGRDLGVVQEMLPGASSGWALAVASLRDMLAAGCSPAAAGGDFAPEALALGRMAARMHLALDRAFGRRSGERPPAIRTHGDFHLGRTARTDAGWVLADCMPGGTVPGSDEPLYRSPLADVADMVWSLHHAAVVATSERGPGTAAPRPAELAQAWEARNRRAFMAGYLSTPGIGGLVPADRGAVRRLVAVFEAARAVRG
jgi:maltokinase